MSICTVVLWLSDFTLSYTFPILTQNIGEGWTFMLYVVVTALSALFGRWYLRHKGSRWKKLKVIGIIEK